MLTVGVRELKEQASEILRRVREEGISVEVTYRGEVIARVVPAEPPPPDEAVIETSLAELEALAAKIGAAWTGGSATEAVDDVRRDL